MSATNLVHDGSSGSLAIVGHGNLLEAIGTRITPSKLLISDKYSSSTESDNNAQHYSKRQSND